MIHFLCRQHLTQFVTRTKHKQFSNDVTLMLQSLKVKVVTLFYFLIFTTVHTTGMVNVGFLEWVHIWFSLYVGKKRIPKYIFNVFLLHFLSLRWIRKVLLHAWSTIWVWKASWPNYCFSCHSCTCILSYTSPTPLRAFVFWSTLGTEDRFHILNIHKEVSLIFLWCYFQTLESKFISTVDTMSLPETMMAVVVHGKGGFFFFLSLFLLQYI